MTRNLKTPKPKSPNLEIYLTEDEFVARYRLGSRTAQRWRKSGDGPPWVRLGARRVVYRVADCEAWATSRTFVHSAAEMAQAAAQGTGRK
jgi:predicted DNA-binding transcriptional regulator AlpA